MYAGRNSRGRALASCGAEPLHPYAKGLMGAIRRHERGPAVGRSPGSCQRAHPHPALAAPSNPRCDYRFDRCTVDRLSPVDRRGHKVAATSTTRPRERALTIGDDANTGGRPAPNEEAFRVSSSVPFVRVTDLEPRFDVSQKPG